jgi:hypothetical protein
MSADPAPMELPSGPVSYEEVLRILPKIRQSTLSNYDGCSLKTFFDFTSWGWSSHPAAAGTTFHLFAAEALRTMMRTGETQIPVSECFEILYEQAAQRDIPLHARVKVPMQHWPLLRLGVLKFAKDNTFSVDRIVGVEERLEAQVPVTRPDGSLGYRTFTGQMDVLMFEPPDAAIIIDWKLTFALPSKPRQAEEEEAWPSAEKEAMKALSWTGYAQQRFYGYLTLKNYPSIQKVTMREFYPARGEVREATLYRADMEHVERELGLLIEGLDAALMAGPEHAGTGTALDPWPASPGTQCRWCAKPSQCPIEAEPRKAGVINSVEDATRVAAEYHVADAVRARSREALKEWCADNGTVPVKNAKGRKVMGFTQSNRFEVFTPQDSDKGLVPPDLPHTDPRLEDAFREALEETEALKVKRRRARRKV